MRGIDIDDVAGLARQLERLENQQRWLAEMLLAGEAGFLKALSEEVESWGRSEVTASARFGAGDSPIKAREVTLTLSLDSRLRLRLTAEQAGRLSEDFKNKREYWSKEMQRGLEEYCFVLSVWRLKEPTISVSVVVP